MPITLVAIEDALIGRAESALGRLVRAVIPLPGGGGQLVDLLEHNRVVPPCVYFSWEGATRPAAAAGLRLVSTWRAIAVTQHAGGEVDRRRGDALAIGGYEILERMAAALHDWTVPAVGTLTLMRMGTIDAPAYQGKGVSFATLELQIGHDLDPSALPDEEATTGLPDFITFHSDFDLAPPDEVIEVEDTLTLHQD